MAESTTVLRRPWEQAVDYVNSRTAGPPLDLSLDVTIHFHPDSPVNDVSLLERLVKDGLYRSQFETGTGNGGLTAWPGGERWRWEQRMFGGAYDSAPAAERPKYGSLNYRRLPVGGSVRFGSSHFRLKHSEYERLTFCFPDSSTEPEHFGTMNRMPLVGVAAEYSGESGLDVLDDHIEAHIHGPLQLNSHIAALVLDPSYRGTEVEAAARRLPCPVEWHEGFRLSADELEQHAEYRGRTIVSAGQSIAEDGWLDPRTVGRAVRDQRFDRQTLKQIWHCVARFGYNWGAAGIPSPPRHNN
ncbi:MULTISPECIES: DUF3626 domain-containing protein [unclassified Arthrobacter]|uniref:DUF3626 domain-containing protein n=1 Tax=unclassified Arthrobacter TaxID=235627 RepID=UPI000CE54CCB|nr:MULTISPECIES: DUF3626 domain-containing protein [unclassified Arthrobacter]